VPSSNCISWAGVGVESDLFFFNFAIWAASLPSKLSPWDFPINDQLFTWVIIENKVLNNINMNKNLEHMSFLYLTRPNKVNLGISASFISIANQSEKHHLRNLRRILTECPTLEGMLVQFPPGGLLHMVYDGFVTQHFVNHRLRLGMLRDPLNANLYMVWNVG
jgi:hypothetical protein